MKIRTVTVGIVLALVFCLFGFLFICSFAWCQEDITIIPQARPAIVEVQLNDLHFLNLTDTVILNASYIDENGDLVKTETIRWANTEGSTEFTDFVTGLDINWDFFDQAVKEKLGIE
jgi:hypothetical protein